MKKRIIPLLCLLMTGHLTTSAQNVKTAKILTFGGLGLATISGISALYFNKKSNEVAKQIEYRITQPSLNSEDMHLLQGLEQKQNFYKMLSYASTGVTALGLGLAIGGGWKWYNNQSKPKTSRPDVENAEFKNGECVIANGIKIVAHDNGSFTITRPNGKSIIINQKEPTAAFIAALSNLEKHDQEQFKKIAENFLKKHQQDVSTKTLSQLINESEELGEMTDKHIKKVKELSEQLAFIKWWHHEFLNIIDHPHNQDNSVNAYFAISYFYNLFSTQKSSDLNSEKSLWQ